MKRQAKLAWNIRVENLKKANVFPKRWKSATMLAHMIARVDPVLLQADHSYVHNLLGKRLQHTPQGKWIETNQYVLPLATAKRIMDSEEFDKARASLLQRNFGDEIQRIGSLSLTMLERNILEGNMDAVKVGLEMSGKYTKHVKHTHESDKKRAEKFKGMIQKAFEHDDVKKLHGNN